MLRRALPLVVVAFSACGPEDFQAPSVAKSTEEALTVGGASLTRCAAGASYYCGNLSRPLDPAGVVHGNISIHYEWYPHTGAGAAVGTVVAIEGGPGYGSCESRDEYLESFDLSQRDMLLVDARGSGKSSAINCTVAQGDNNLTASDVADCGAQLGAKSDLYGSDLAADDMEAILQLLGVGLIDLYGDSYGTLSAQVFAGRHPSRLRTLVLDAAYPVLHADPFFSPQGAGMSAAFDHVCDRSPDCSGNSVTRIGNLLNALRANPGAAPTVNRNGDLGPLAPRDVALLMNVAAEQYNLYSELDPAVRAYLAGDTVPMVRLVNETYPIESGGVGSRPVDYSIGMFLAVTCQDGPTAYDMTLPPGPQRDASWQAALAAQKAKDPNIYAPFTIDEYLSEALDWSITPTCLQWPVSSPQHPQGNPVPSGVMPNVPTLVLTGDLDTVTPVGEGDQVAAEFSTVKRVIVKNGVHVTGIVDPTGCISGVVNDFVASGGHANTGCVATANPAFRLVPSYALTVNDVPLRGVTGNGSNAIQRAARAAVLAAGDSYSRWWNLDITSGSGLRGGTFKVNNAGTKITFTNARFTTDLAISGPMQVDPNGGVNTATLTLSGVATGNVTVTWDSTGAQGVATVVGTINGTSVSINVPAP